ncbi:MAG: thiol-disulfide oxidoreductase DCC family protein [Candidatus Hydrogenedentes bacterium]|nr:thiol-disulfide oxidoreductase DCC family protein [Candidatus Hydrogenedentota bacterium]
MDHPVILFDGVCNLCNASVQFVIRHDGSGRFRFAPLQSETGRNLLDRCGCAGGDLASVVLVEGDRCYRESTAALRVLRGCDGLWRMLYVGIVIPRFLRDAMYRLVARNRYRWFGTREQCMIPTPELRTRFLE